MFDHLQNDHDVLTEIEMYSATSHKPVTTILDDILHEVTFKPPWAYSPSATFVEIRNRSGQQASLTPYDVTRTLKELKALLCDTGARVTSISATRG